MPVRVDTLDAPRLVRYTFEGIWTVQQLLDVRLQLIQKEQLTDKSAVLFDLRAMTDAPSQDEFHTASLKNKSVWPVCRAFIATSEQQYDAARRMRTLLGRDSVINEIFRDEQDALDWLAAMAGRAYESLS